MNTRHARATAHAASHRGRSDGFTLIELTAALGLAVLVMLGIAQMFQMASEVVDRVEAVSDTYQMGRATMQIIERDLASFSGDQGYLMVDVWDNMQPPQTRARYRFDALAFTTLGPYEEIGTANPGGQVSGAAEVYYSFGARKHSDSSQVHAWAGLGSYDQRGVVLTRKPFLIASQGLSPGSYLPKAPVTDCTSALPMMTAEPDDPPTPNWRVRPPVLSRWPFNIMPEIDVDPKGGFDPNVHLVICDRVSQFIVQWPVENQLGDGHTWFPPLNQDARDQTYVWTSNSVKPRGGAAGDKFAHYGDTRRMPSMLRITLVVHSYNDVEPMSDQPYSDHEFHGEVFRQVYTLNGQVPGERSSQGIRP